MTASGPGGTEHPPRFWPALRLRADSLMNKAMRKRAAAHGLEAVGEKRRAMMPWIAEGRLVDKAKN